MRRSWLIYAVIYSFFLATLGYGEVRLATKEDLAVGNPDNTITQDGHVGHYISTQIVSPFAVDVRDMTTWSTDKAAAFASALSGGNKTIVIPDGTWTIGGSTTWLSVEDNTTIIMGRNAVLNFTGDNTSYRYGFRIFGASHVTISGGTIKGNRSTQASGGGFGIVVSGGLTSGSRDILVENVTAEDWRTDGFMIGGGVGATDNVRVINCKADNVGRSGLTIAGDTSNIYVDGFIGSNTNGFSPEAGMDLEPDLGYSATDITIVNSRFFGNAGNGMYIQSGNGTTTKVTLRDNKAYSNGAYGISIINIDYGLADGNHAWQNVTAGMGIQSSAYWTITKNVLDNNPNANLEVNTLTDSIISENTLSNSPDGDGAVIRVNSARVRFVKNNIRGNGAYGIDIANVTDSAFDENQVTTSVQAGITIGALLNNSSVSRNFLKDNRSAGSGSWDAIQTGDNTVLNTTIASNIARGAHRYGLFLGPNCDNNIVMLNDFRDPALVSGSFYDGGTGTITGFDNAAIANFLN